jgi:hypothetical protein
MSAPRMTTDCMIISQVIMQLRATTTIPASPMCGNCMIVARG